MYGISLKIMNNENLWRKEAWIFIFPNVFKQGWEFERNPPQFCARLPRYDAEQQLQRSQGCVLPEGCCTGVVSYAKRRQLGRPEFSMEHDSNGICIFVVANFYTFVVEGITRFFIAAHFYHFYRMFRTRVGSDILFLIESRFVSSCEGIHKSWYIRMPFHIFPPRFFSTSRLLIGKIAQLVP